MADVVGRLIDIEGCSLVALSEVRREHVLDWVPAGRRKDWKAVTDTSGARHDFDVALLYEATRFDLEQHTWVGTNYGGHRVRAGLVVTLSTTRGSLVLAAAHWRSDASNAADGSARRTRAAGALVQKIAAEASLLTSEVPVLVLADFNAEPFDLPDMLPTARSRDTVRAHRARASDDLLLYNAAWRLLGERDALKLNGATRTLAGTYRSRNNVPSAWRTFDHVLVSGALLGRSTAPSWRLREETLDVWTDAAVYDIARSRPRLPFDHLPICGHLQWTSDAEAT